MRRMTRRNTVLSLFALFAGLLLNPPDSRAAEFFVNNTVDAVDANPGDGVCQTNQTGVCTLRAAVQESNALAGADIIHLPLGLYHLSLWGPDEDAAATGDLDITGDLTILGAGVGTKGDVPVFSSPPPWYDGSDASIINGNAHEVCLGNLGCNDNESWPDKTPWDRLLHIHGAIKVNLSGLVLRSGALVNASGGAIHNAAGELTITSSVFYNNRLDGCKGYFSQGDICNPATIPTPAPDPWRTKGGAIYNSGNLSVTNTRFYNNQSHGVSECSLFDCPNGTGNPWGGGAIYHTGSTATIKDSVFTANDGDGGGGGIFNAFSQSLTIDNSVFEENSGSLPGGGALVNLLSQTTITGGTFRKNRGGVAGSCGGAIYNITGTVKMAYSSITENALNPIFQLGGGLCNFDKMEVAYSTLSGNRSALGGGIYNNGPGVLTLINSTVSGNLVGHNVGFTRVYAGDPTSESGYGGGIYNGATVRLINSTLYGNMADRGGAGVYQRKNTGSALTNALQQTPYTGVIELKNSIIAGNDLVFFGGLDASEDATYPAWSVRNVVSRQDCVAYAATDNITSRGYNIGSDGTCRLTAAGDRPNTDPLLGPLANNGGPTLTHALNTGSPAINAGDNSECPYASSLGRLLDQRLFERADGQCDIGAFEAGAVAVPLADLKLVVEQGVPFGVIRAAAPDGQTLWNYKLTVTNTGLGEATDVVLTSRIMLNGTVAAVSPETLCQKSADGIRCDIDRLAVGETATIMLAVIPKANGALSNRVSVKANEIDPLIDTNTVQVATTVEGIPADNTGTGGTGGTGTGGTTSGTGGGGGGAALFDFWMLLTGFAGFAWRARSRRAAA